LFFASFQPIFGKKIKLHEIKIYKLLFYLKNPFHNIVPLLFTNYSRPSGLPACLPVLLLLLLGFLPEGKGVERREEKRRDQTWLPTEKLKQGEARHDAIFCYCSCTQSDFSNSFFL